MNKKQRQNLERACRDLEANTVKARNNMRVEETGGRCCLAVMADTACDIKDIPRGCLDHPAGALPVKALAGIFGLPNLEDTESPCFNFMLGGIQATLHNDGSADIGEKTHAEIAAMIREEYLKPDP